MGNAISFPISNPPVFVPLCRVVSFWSVSRVCLRVCIIFHGVYSCWPENGYALAHSLFLKRRYFELEIVVSVFFRYVSLFELLEALIISRKTK